jgi:hypothetical protein
MGKVNKERQYLKPEMAKAEAQRMAEILGCSGLHQDEKGNWMPCASHEELQKISNEAESYSAFNKNRQWGYGDDKKSVEEKKKRKRRGKKTRRIGDQWEELEGRGPISIDSLPGGGIVSGTVSSKSADVRVGPEYVRDNDPDVFIDPESARFRSRQLGCIGISRRISKTGRSVWMPCTNMSDYSRVAGATSLGRRRRSAEFERSVRTIVSTELDKRRKKNR